LGGALAAVCVVLSVAAVGTASPRRPMAPSRVGSVASARQADAASRAASSSLPSCTGAFGRFAGPAMDAQRSGADVIAITAIDTWGASRCQLRVKLTAVVHTPGSSFYRGVVRGIRLPRPASINITLNPGDVVAREWKWSNWCGRGGRFELLAWWGPDVAESAIVDAPACRSRSAPSTLKLVALRAHPCTSRDYRVRAGFNGGFESHLITGAAISLIRGHRPCVLRARVTFSLQQQHGTAWATLTQIDGNPGHQTTGALLMPGNPMQLFWAWFNWCGPATPQVRFRAAARIGDQTVAGQPSASTNTSRLPPQCEAPASPSTLTSSYGTL